MFVMLVMPTPDNTMYVASERCIWSGKPRDGRKFRAGRVRQISARAVEPSAGVVNLAALNKLPLAQPFDGLSWVRGTHSSQAPHPVFL